MAIKRPITVQVRQITKLVILIVLAFIAGYLVRSWTNSNFKSQISNFQPEAGWWTCSMHPQIRQPKPGKCPICFMDLIPVATEHVDVGPRQISFSKEAIKLMEIETTPVERKFATAEIRMVGKIDYDETQVKHITAWVPGRIDRLFVDFTGITVAKGDHMVELYSPELLSAQAELLQAVKAASNIKSETSELVKRSTLATLEAAGEKLRLLGLTEEQIEKIEASGEPVTHLIIYSPIGGIVINKHATEGMYVQTGTPIYTVADLSHLWVKLDAYESDLPWIRYGQETEFTTEAYPGEIFKGKISFIDPVLNDKTRTIKVRVDVDNSDGKLKPGMFVKAVVRANIARGGRAMTPELAGSWICPMHPSVIKAEPGVCDICGMNLVTPESLGYVKADVPKEAPLVIPASAPLITGTRAVVYVQVPETEKPTFEGREIVLGPRAGDYYIVRSGLAEGEIVVTNGNFKIDSALQIQAKPSMMNPKGHEMPAGHQGHSH
jgi:Cu(I)/Ag(I) efflux system membrane fusion protein